MTPTVVVLVAVEVVVVVVLVVVEDIITSRGNVVTSSQISHLG